MRLSWNETLTALGGAYVGEPGLVPEAVTGVSTDNRLAGPGDLYCCIRGPRFDGHDFAAGAVERGAVAVVAERPLALPGVPVVVVEDAVRALGRLAHAWRARTTATVIGITGTAGKTTVKDLLSQVLARGGKTACTNKNLNNQYGLPRSVLATDGDERYWVMEAGISRAGDMDELGGILEPDMAVILNAGSGHTEGLGRNVARHKATLLRWLAPGGIGLVCADYPDLAREARVLARPDTRLVFFSGSSNPPAEARYVASYLGPAGDCEGRMGRYAVSLDGWRGVLRAPFRGNFGAENVAAVSAAACLAGMAPEDIAQGLAAASLPDQRFQCSRAGRWLLVDDSYNANPLSMSRMVESAADRAAHAPGGAVPLLCVLGEMLELGDLAVTEHEKLGQCLAGHGARLVLWKGGQGEAVLRGLTREGFAGDFAEFSRADEVPELLKARGGEEGVVLFKGSRGNRLEECVAAVRACLGAPDAV